MCYHNVYMDKFSISNANGSFIQRGAAFMSGMKLARRLVVALTISSFMLGTAGNTYGASRVNLDRNDTVYNNVSEDFEPVKSEPRYSDDAIKVGYIVVGDDEMLLDDQTMGYIRRMLNAKFPGTRYPSKRITDERPRFEMGRRNFGNKYEVTEAHDVLMKEFEKLENMYERMPERYMNSRSRWNTSSSGINLGFGWNKASSSASSSASASSGSDSSSASGAASGSGDGIFRNFNIGVDVGGGTTHVEDSNLVEGYDSLGADNSYNFTEHLSTLPKEDYVRFARELQAEGLSNYDYLLMFNIHGVNRQVKGKALGKSMWSDYRVTVRAIDVNTGEYIDRAEYLKRGYSGSGSFNSPSWRRGMRRAIIDGMVECFDNIPIGKYSVCDNPYCARRQEEIHTQEVFGKINRHCVKHCNDKTVCYDHMVDYTHDADLPGGYIDHSHEHID